MDELERQILANREQLDQVDPVAADQMWAQLSPRLPDVKSQRHLRQYRRWLAVAAGLLLLLSTLLWRAWQQSEPPAMQLGDLSPELAEQENQYLQLISAKTDSLNLDQLWNTDLAPLLDELAIVDSLHAEYQKELPEYGNELRLVNTLIRYYELKLRILNQIENELYKQAHYESDDLRKEI